MDINIHSYEEFFKSLKKHFEEKILPIKKKEEKKYYVFTYERTFEKKEFFIKVNSYEELYYLLLFKIDEGALCKVIYENKIESEELKRPIALAESFVESDMYSLREINFITM